MQWSIIMKYVYSAFLFASLLISFFSGLFLNVAPQVHLPPNVVRYQLEISNDNYLPVNEANLTVFAPVKEIGFQKTTNINASEPFELESDKYGNQLLSFTINNMAPFSKRYITVTATVIFDGSRQDKALVDLSTVFLKNEKYLDLNNLKIRSTASLISNETVNKSPLNVAQELHSWVVNNLSYAGYQKQDLGAAYAIKHLKGDCTEYMYLSSALMRAQKIPNIPVAGFSLGRSKSILKAADYHNWNYFIDDGILKISDTQGNVFNEKEDQYIVFRILAKDELSPLSNTHRFSISDSQLKVKLI